MIDKREGKRGTTWRVRVYGPTNSVTGRRVQKSATYTSLAEARRAEKQFAFELRDGYGPSGSRERFAGWLAHWHDGRKDKVAATTWARQSDFVKLVQRFMPAVKLEKLTAVDLERFYAALARDGRADGKGGLAPRTCHHVHRFIHRALRDAVRKGLVDRNIAALADAPVVPVKAMALPSASDVALVQGKLRNSRYWPLFALAQATGARRGELVALKWSDIDFDQHTVSIARAAVRVNRKTLVKSPKSKSGIRTIKLPAGIMPLLAQWRSAQREEMLRLGYRIDGDWLMTSRNGNILSPSTLSTAARAAGEAAGISAFTLHKIRHIQATELMRANVHPKVAQARLGHSRVSTTLDIYSHADPAMQNEAATIIDGLVKF